jgi:protocatechuate 3,4-dioxygenase beta subunit
MVAPTCVVRPEMTEGPYFVDEMLNRSDIRIEPSDGSVKAGTILRLIFNLSAVSADACTPLEGAQVDVWHCDATGMYSDVQDPGFSTAGQKWLRGYQISDATGKAEFTTIYPGWYSGRAIHIHFKIRTDPESDSGYEFTSQLFFDDALSDVVFTDQPYASRGATRSTLNANDSIYRNGGDQLLLQPVKEDDGSYTATFDIGLDLSDAAVGASDSASMGGGRGAPGGALPGRNPDAMPTPTPAST